jgi:hypothetical protein
MSMGLPIHRSRSTAWGARFAQRLAFATPQRAGAFGYVPNDSQVRGCPNRDPLQCHLLHKEGRDIGGAGWACSKEPWAVCSQRWTPCYWGLIALVLAPLATQLPKKFSSIFCAMPGKDILSLGNMTWWSRSCRATSP